MDRERLKANVESVRGRIRGALARAGRTGEIVLLVVTKYAPPEAIDALRESGITDCGENRVLEGLERIAQVREAFRWHFVGHLQTNKVRRALERFEVIHSIDRWEIAERLQKELERLKKEASGFVQVNVSGEATKGGAPPTEAPALAERIRRNCPRIRLVGLMTMAPHDAGGEEARPLFRRLRECGNSCGLAGLSMGMTNDFEVAVEEGATHVRIGSAIFDGVLGSMS